MKKIAVYNALIVIGFSVYFLLLGFERLLALSYSVLEGGVYAVSSGSFIALFTYLTTALSLTRGLVYGCVFGLPTLGRYIKTKRLDYDGLSPMVLFSAMLLMVGGMMHTGFTLLPLQFTAYGFLIMAMLVKALKVGALNPRKRILSLFSFVYITLYSMTIPVCYAIASTGPASVAYYALEIAAVILLLPSFGLMLHAFFKTGLCRYSWAPLLMMLALDIPVIVLKWNEEINAFLLIFAVLSALFFLFVKLWNKKHPEDSDK